MKDRSRHNALQAAVSIYEMHLGSWRRVPEENNRWLTYRELAPVLADYVHDAGFTHVEFLPVMEHVFDGSWGSEPDGYFAPSSRYGTPGDFMYLVDHLHRRGIGVILDWPAMRFAKDAHFPQLKHLLIGNALFWLEQYHADGLRMDALAGRGTPEVSQFLRELNEQVYKTFPDVMMIAGESDGWPLVSHPTYAGGLGFGLKWNTDWAHDTLEYMARDPIFRSYHHDRIASGLAYAFTENFILPFPHGEVAGGNGSLIAKMPGDDWRKFANLRLLYGFMFGLPGKKLLFMGDEFGQWAEWDHDRSLDWHLLQYPIHSGLLRWVRDLNTLYRGQPALFQIDFSPEGFEWVDRSDSQRSVVSFIRRGNQPEDLLLFVCNFTPVPRANYRVGATAEGRWKELLNSDAPLYGGSGQGNEGGLEASPLPMHGRPFSLNMTIPPLAVVVFQPENGRGPGR